METANLAGKYCNRKAHMARRLAANPSINSKVNPARVVTAGGGSWFPRNASQGVSFSISGNAA
jgi:hypothetical protein